MRGMLAAAMMVGVLAAAQAGAQCSDPFDAVLCVNTITAQQEAQFNAGDAQVSAFWAGLSGDSFELVPPDNCYPGNCNFSGASDGTMTVKAAGTGRGIYLYVEVQDNVWVDWSGGNSYGDDSVDLYFDKLDANTVHTCTDCKIGLYSSDLSYTTQQVQVFMGASSPPSTFRFAYYDAAQWSWVTVNMTWADAKVQYGFEAEVVSVDATHKVQEWYFPWDKYGTGISQDELAPGRLLGFAGGYNDMDGDNPTPDKLRWPHGGDPWASDQNYWGDLSVQAMTGVRQPHPTGIGCRAAETGRRELFTLLGSRVPGAPHSSAACGLVVQRMADRTGVALLAVTGR